MWCNHCPLQHWNKTLSGGVCEQEERKSTLFQFAQFLRPRRALGLCLKPVTNASHPNQDFILSLGFPHLCHRHTLWSPHRHCQPSSAGAHPGLVDQEGCKIREGLHLMVKTTRSGVGFFLSCFAFSSNLSNWEVVAGGFEASQVYIVNSTPARVTQQEPELQGKTWAQKIKETQTTLADKERFRCPWPLSLRELSLFCFEIMALAPESGWPVTGDPLSPPPKSDGIIVVCPHAQVSAVIQQFTKTYIKQKGFGD